MSREMKLFDDEIIWGIQNEDLTPRENFEKWRERWELNLKKEKVSKKSVRAYLTAIELFLNWVEKHPSTKITEIGARYINQYIIWYQMQVAEKKIAKRNLNKNTYRLLWDEKEEGDLGLNDANFTIFEEFENTIMQRMTILKMFLKYVSLNNIEQHDFTRLFSQVAKVTIHDRFTDYLTSKELFEVIEYMKIWPTLYADYYPKSSERNAYRNALLLTLYATTGARGEEIAKVRLRDITEHESKKTGKKYYIIKIEHAKGDKKRTVSVERKHLEKFIKYLEEALPSRDFYISSTWRKDEGYTNLPEDINAIRTFANDIYTLLNIKKRGLHAFRRGYVTKRIGEEKVDVATVAKEIGNTSSVLEKHYLKHSAEAFLE